MWYTPTIKASQARFHPIQGANKFSFFSEKGVLICAMVRTFMIGLAMLFLVTTSRGQSKERDSSPSLPDSSISRLSLLPDDSTRVYWLMDQAIYVSGADLALSQAYSEMAYEIAGTLDDPIVLLNATQTLGTVYLHRGMNAEGILLFETTLAEMSPKFRKEQPERMMRLHNNLGGGYFAVGDIDMAIQEFTRARSFAEELEDMQSVGLCYQNIGACFRSQMRVLMAEEFFQKSLEIKKELGDSNYIVSTYISLADLEIDFNENYEKAREYLEIAQEIAKEIDNKRQIADVRYRWAIIYSKLEKWGEAESYLAKTLALSGKTGDSPQEASLLSLRGNVLFHQGRFPEAEKSLRKANQIAESMEDLDRSSYAKYWLVEVLAAQRDSGQAFLVHKQYSEEVDSLRTQSNRKEIASAEARYKVKLSQQKYEKERDAKEAAHRKQRTILIGGLLALGLLALLFGRERVLRAKQKELDRVKLEAFTQKLSEKNKLIATLEEHNEQSEQDGAVDVYPELLKMKILTDEDWHDFLLLFTKVYPSFIPKVRKNFPELSQGDQRLFFLLKLRLTNKEISGMLGISGQGVKVARHRLRKKLSLQTGESLEGAINKF